MLPTLASPSRSRRSALRPVPFRYSAAVSGTGEIQEIQQFLGRRLVRRVDPSGRLGRRLLVDGQVALWCNSIVEGQRLPVTEVLDRLHEQASRAMKTPGGKGWARCCRERLRTIESWQAFYRAALPESRGN